MEAYVAEGRRPVDKCLADGRECDVYIGRFAWRYGWIPAELNPEQLSIAHLEYKQGRPQVARLSRMRQRSADCYIVLPRKFLMRYAVSLRCSGSREAP